MRPLQLDTIADALVSTEESTSYRLQQLLVRVLLPRLPATMRADVIQRIREARDTQRKRWLLAQFAD